MIRHIIKKICVPQYTVLSRRNKTTSPKLIEYDFEDIQDVNDDLEENERKEEEIGRKQNKSRLQPAHQNLVHDKIPYSKPVMLDFHKTIKYQRKLYGVYGKTSEVNPEICWPTKEDIENTQEYERVKYPHTIQHMIEQNIKKKKDIYEERMKKQEDIVKKFAKLDQWKKDLRDKISKKEAEARSVKERKDRLVEEVRRHFGFKIDPRDERFKEMLEQKERAEKKSMKEAKRKVKEAKLIAKLQDSKAEPKTLPEPIKTTSEN